ncbi:uncharacterized protein LOC136086529 [Hydra vulgaris]|uniref:Uncharacterized protein LOC136086529 n=1 Tax=Hydra vulgaris TaxID=6087 RepID=A0ABM4CSJ0_HYDVU
MKRKRKTVFSDWVDSDDDEIIEPVPSDLPEPGFYYSLLSNHMIKKVNTEKSPSFLSTKTLTNINRSTASQSNNLSTGTSSSNSALTLILSKLAAIQHEVSHIVLVQNNIFNALQSLIVVQKKELPDGFTLPIATLVELNDGEIKLRNKETVQTVERLEAQMC